MRSNKGANKGDGGLDRSDMPGDGVGGDDDQRLVDEIGWASFLIKLHCVPVLRVEHLGDAAPGWTNADGDGPRGGRLT